MFQSLRSFLFLKKNVPFFSRVFGDLWDTKERSVLFRSFLKNERECKERNVLLQRTEKNAMFFCKERKRTQRSSAKNGKERENVSFFCKRTRERSVLFSIYIYRYIYRHIYINIFQKKNGTFFKKNGTLFYVFFFLQGWALRYFPFGMLHSFLF